MSHGPHRFRDAAGVEWVAVFYREGAQRFPYSEQPGQMMLAFLEGVEEGLPRYEIPAPPEVPEPPSETWLRSLLEGAKARKAMDGTLAA